MFGAAQAPSRLRMISRAPITGLGASEPLARSSVVKVTGTRGEGNRASQERIRNRLKRQGLKTIVST